MIRAKAKIILSVDPVNYIHIQNSAIPKEAWENLQTAFEDSGLTRRVSLLRDLSTTQLQNYVSTEEYVNRIMSTAHKLNSLNFEVKDEWIGTLLLAGLPDDYRPMIMGLENSGIPITGDSIKTKLLQDIQHNASGKGNENDSALFVNRNGGNNRKSGKTSNFNNQEPKGPRCFACNKHGHFARNCKNSSKKSRHNLQSSNQWKANDSDSSTKEKSYKAFFALSVQNKVELGSWYVDSGASSHMSHNKAMFYFLDENFKSKVEVADYGILKVKGIGNIKLLGLKDQNDIVDVRDVLYVPGISTNLISVGQLIDRGLQVKFDQTGCQIRECFGILMVTATKVSKGFKLDCQQISTSFTKEQIKEDL